MTLAGLYLRVFDGWRFDRGHYALLPNGERDRERFALRNLAMHVGKTSGKIQALIEPMDHSGRDLDEEGTREMARQISYMIINVLRLASLTGVPVMDILANVSNWEEEHRGPK